MRNLKHAQKRALFMLALVSFSFSFSVSAVAADAVTSPPAKLDKAIAQKARLNDEVLRLSQPLTCKSDSDCASLAMGAKPCGGPWKYVLYSKRNTKVAALKKKLDEYNKLDQKQNEATQVMSDCSVAMEPIAKCEKSVCIDSANANAANAREGLDKIAPITKPAVKH